MKRFLFPISIIIVMLLVGLDLYARLILPQQSEIQEEETSKILNDSFDTLPEPVVDVVQYSKSESARPKSLAIDNDTPLMGLKFRCRRTHH